VEVVGKAIVERDGHRAARQRAPVQSRLDDLVQREHHVVAGQVGDLGREPFVTDARKERIFLGDDAMGAEDHGTAPGKASRDQRRHTAVVEAPAE